MKSDSYLSPQTQFKVDLNVRRETLKPFQENEKKRLQDMNTDKDSLKGTPAPQEIKPSIDKLNSMKLRTTAQKRK